ncbi:MAG TPA: hypothetical protein VGO17_04055 [Aurantimonas sp.]|jgi:TolB-like protein|nr:hypothetical protein [Aurantimonas sp.]
MSSLRRLAAILSMDVEGYTSLLENDEAGTLAAVDRALGDVAFPTIGDHGGIVFKTTGDGFLAEFSSVVNAVQWTAWFQRTLAADQGAAEKPLLLRAGIVIGDVIVAGDDRFGDGVVAATRVERYSPAGGMAISKAVFDYLRGKTDLYFTALGSCSLKGYSEPQPLWVWTPQAAAASAPHRLAAPDPAHQPSVAVLPFVNLGDDPAHDRFLDGLAEEIVASLSRVREFHVTARQSTLAYRGSSKDAREIASELAVRYLLEGSARFSAERIRISLQLVDGETGLQIWTDRVDARIDDLFEVQDYIAERVCGALHSTIRHVEIERSRRKPPHSLAAYDRVMQALPHLWAHRQTENAAAIALIEAALDGEPEDGRAAAIGAWAHAQNIAYNWESDIPAQRRKGAALLERTLGRIDDDPLALTAAATATMLIHRDIEKANAFIDRALELDVNNAWAWTRRGFLRIYAGLADDAFACFERSLRLSPLDPFAFNSFIGIGLAHFSSGQPQEAARWTRRALAEKPGMTWPHRDLAAFFGAAGDREAAERALAVFMSTRPWMTRDCVAEALRFMNPRLLGAYLGGLEAAGLGRLPPLLAPGDAASRVERRL